MTTTALPVRHYDPALAAEGVQFFAMRLYRGKDDVLAYAMTHNGRSTFPTREAAQNAIDAERARAPHAEQIARGQRILATDIPANVRAEIEENIAALSQIDYAVYTRTVSPATPA